MDLARMNDQKSATKAPVLLAVSLALLAPLPAYAQPPASNATTTAASSQTAKAPVPAALQQSSVDERALIFERFARGVTAGRRSGSEGAVLGLALVDEHVRMHGGRVWVEDRRDGQPGARFVIELSATSPDELAEA